MKIYTIGDSHSVYGFKQTEIPILSLHPTGPVLMYSVGRDGLDRIDIRNFITDDEPGDAIVFSFGEIDCRCQIHKYVRVGKTYKEIIEPMVGRYFETIRANVSNYKNLVTCVYNIVPPVATINGMIDGWWVDTKYPLVGSDEERKEYTLYMNKCIKNCCKEYGYIFFDVYDKYISNDGFLNKEMSEGVHITDGRAIKEFIETIIFPALSAV
jgi:hypothetical protein